MTAPIPPEHGSDVLVSQQLEALEHCLRIFESLANRGRYPQELLPDSPHFLGKQGWEFLTDAIKSASSAAGKSDV